MVLGRVIDNAHGDSISYEVTGVKENVVALKHVGAYLDTVAAAHQAWLELIPFIRNLSRVDTGRMVAGFLADEDFLVNDVEYSGYQEFGTLFTPGVHAIGEAVGKDNGQLVITTFVKATDEAIHKAGY